MGHAFAINVYLKHEAEEKYKEFRVPIVAVPVGSYCTRTNGVAFDWIIVAH